MVKLLRRLALGLLAVALAVLAGMLVPRPFWPSAEDGPRTRQILVVTNPIHTDVAIPIDPEIRERFAFLEQDGIQTGHPEARWLIFGWGGRAFYIETPTWAELKPVPLLKALTVDSSVLHVDVVGEIPDPHPAVTRFEISEAAFGRMADFIAATFKRAEDMPVAIAGRGYGPTDRFYEAEGWFNALAGCNTWTAQALRAGGVRTGWWNPLPVTLAASLELYND